MEKGFIRLAKIAGLTAAFAAAASALTLGLPTAGVAVATASAGVVAGGTSYLVSSFVNSRLESSTANMNLAAAFYYHGLSQLALVPASTMIITHHALKSAGFAP